jgi:hypothetical protein
MKIDKSTIISLLSLLLLVGCNKKEYCDFSTYDVSTVLHYDWTGVTEKVPASLNNIMTSSAASTSFVSASDWYQLKQEDGNYNVFAWNDAENVTVSNKIITVAKNDDGSLKSVGELFTGERDFNIKNATAEDNEAGNHHHWNDPPYHTGKGVVFDTIDVKMKAQTRTLRMIVKVTTDEELIEITKMTAEVTGLTSYRSTDDVSGGVKDGLANLTFEKVNDSTYVASIRVIGNDEAEKQIVNLTVNFSDGSSSEPLADISGDMKDFNNNLGGDDKNIGLNMSVVKAKVGFAAVITDWNVIDGGTVDVPY